MKQPQQGYNIIHRFPTWTVTIFFVGIFCLFAPIGILLVTEIANPPSLLGWLVIGGFSGFTAVGWALVGTWNWKLVFLVGPSQALWPVLFSVWREPLFRHAGPALDPNAIAMIVLAVTAYIIFIFFIRTQGISALRLQTEIALAQQIHEEQVPPIRAKVGPLSIYGTSVASTEMGGDLIDLIADDERTDVILADVTGHGVKAGIIMTMLKSAIRTRLRTGGTPEEIVRDLNNVFVELTDPGMFATFVMMRFDAGGGLTIINAGHPAVIQRSSDGTVTEHESTAMPIGVAPDQEFEPITVRPTQGDLFLIYTDGLTEVSNSRGEMANNGLVDETVRAATSAENAVETLLELAAKWGPADDDRSAIAITIGP